MSGDLLGYAAAAATAGCAPAVQWLGPARGALPACSAARLEAAMRLMIGAPLVAQPQPRDCGLATPPPGHLLPLARQEIPLLAALSIPLSPRQVRQSC